MADHQTYGDRVTEAYRRFAYVLHNTPHGKTLLEGIAWGWAERYASENLRADMVEPIVSVETRRVVEVVREMS